MGISASATAIPPRSPPQVRILMASGLNSSQIFKMATGIEMLIQRARRTAGIDGEDIEV